MLKPGLESSVIPPIESDMVSYLSIILEDTLESIELVRYLIDCLSKYEIDMCLNLKNRVGYLSNYLSSWSTRRLRNRFLFGFAANYEIDLCFDLKSERESYLTNHLSRGYARKRRIGLVSALPTGIDG